jgi:hypothetical protein
MSNWTEDPEYFEGFVGETKREGDLLMKYQTKVYKSDIKVLEEQKYDGTKTLWFGVGTAVGAFVLMSVIFLLTYDFSLDQ